MMIIGCDFHTRYQQIAMMNEATGELTERRLDHQSGEADKFYRNLQGAVRVGIEATGGWRTLSFLYSEPVHNRGCRILPRSVRRGAKAQSFLCRRSADSLTY